MKLVRTYPPLDPDLMRVRNRVDDDAPRCYISEYDNRSLTDFLAQDVTADILLLEWDIAVSREDLYLFAEVAKQTPERVLVAPYRLYPNSSDQYPESGVWAHRTVTEPNNLLTRFVTTADLVCDLFSFGMVYLPGALIKRFCVESVQPMTDGHFSAWHYRAELGPVPICWAVTPVHLNYTAPSEL